MHKFSQGLQKSIEEWETERRQLIIEKQELLKITKTFLEQSNQLFEFCKTVIMPFYKEVQNKKEKLLK